MTLPKLLTTADVSEQTGLTAPAVARAIRRGELPARRIGRGWRVAEADVERWLASHPGNDRAVELAGEVAS